MELKNITQLFLLLLLVLSFGCSDDDEVAEWSNRVALLQVDYTTGEFEGGTELLLSADVATTDSLPIGVDYDEPNDFGSISLYYNPTKEILFFGTMIWNGTGEVKFPYHFSPPASFAESGDLVGQPDDSRFQPIFYRLAEDIDYAEIWDAVNQLEMVEEYLSDDKKIGLFLYRPSVGEGNPAEWDWYIILNNGT